MSGTNRLQLTRTDEVLHHVAGNVLLVVCAYNEARALPDLLNLVPNTDVLVVDDGSVDGTSEVVTRYGAALIVHPHRLGKSFSLQDALNYAKAKRYEMVLEIGADAVPGLGAFDSLLRALQEEDVGGVSIWQVPLGPKNVAYFIDDLIWALLNHGKMAQIVRHGSCHTGGVMYGFKVRYVSTVEGAINDDEQLGLILRSHGLRTAFVNNARVYFDASSSVGHILERRRRMITGHMIYPRSTAPSMDASVLGLALVHSLRERPKRLFALFPAIALECVSRLLAWRDVRNPRSLEKTRHWVTTYAKNPNPRIPNRDSR